MTKAKRARTAGARAEYCSLAEQGFICLEEVDADEAALILQEYKGAPAPAGSDAAPVTDAVPDEQPKAKRSRTKKGDKKEGGADKAAAQVAPKKADHAEEVRRRSAFDLGALAEALPAWAPFAPALGAYVLSCVRDAGYAQPTPVQAAVLRELAGRSGASLGVRDLLVTAPTGSGKTLAFLLPIMADIAAHKVRSSNAASVSEQQISGSEDTAAAAQSGIAPTGSGLGDIAAVPTSATTSDRPPVYLSPADASRPDSAGDFSTPEKETRGPRALVVAPTRELAVQIADCARRVFPGVHTVAAIGGLSSEKQERLLGYGADVLVATPGRLAEILTADTAGVGAHVRAGRLGTLVLDEADRLVERGHFEDLDVLFEALPRACRQTMLFSATLFSSAASSLSRLRKRVPFAGRFPASVVVSSAGAPAASRRAAVAAPETLRMAQVSVSADAKDAALVALLEDMARGSAGKKCRAIVFVNAIETVRVLSETLRLLGVSSVQALHAHLQQRQRARSLEGFLSGSAGGATVLSRLSVLVTSDVAARGLDLPAVDVVVQYHVPRGADTLQHRAGRTARAGAAGLCVVLATHAEAPALLRAAGAALAEHALDASVLARWARPARLAAVVARSSTLQSRKTRSRQWERHAAEVLGVDAPESDSDSEGDPVSAQRAELSALLRSMS